MPEYIWNRMSLPGFTNRYQYSQLKFTIVYN